MYDGLAGGDISKKKDIRLITTYEAFEWEELRRWKFYNNKLTRDKNERRRSEH